MPPCAWVPSPLLDNTPWTQRDAEAARRCLRGRRVWVLGNSVARHWAFVLVDLLLHNATKPRSYSPMLRADEKHRCGAGGALGGKVPSSKPNCFGLCGCDFWELDGLLGRDKSLTFLWEWSLAANATAAALGGPLSPDVVVYNAGVTARMMALEGKSSENEEARARLRAMIEATLAERPSMRFYWRSTTATCRGWVQFNEEQARLNRAIERSICGVERLRSLDAFNWTLNRCPSYDDRIHHSRLAFQHVTTWLRAECTEVGAATGEGVG